MAGQSILQFLSDLLLRVMAWPEAWGIILILIFAGYMALKKFPASSVAYISMILIVGLVSMGIGGSIETMRLVLYAISGASVIAGILHIAGKL